MRAFRLRNASALLLLGALSAAGCGSGRQPLTPVRGTVNYRGLPLHGGVIVFTPDVSRGTRGNLANAEIQADGTYVLHTGDAAGAVPGWHHVTVAAVQAAPGASPGQRFAIPQSVLPERYRDPDFSGLTEEVKAGKENVIDFNLQ
jgi:hypothetical protein